MCKGTAPSVLQQYGFAMIQQPRAAIKILDLFELHQRKLYPLNTSVTTILTTQGSEQLPTPITDESFTPIEGKHVQEIEAALGVSILKHVIPGYSASLEAKYGRAQVFEFRFLNVTRDSIDIVRTEEALSQIATDRLRGSVRQAGLTGSLFLTTSLLRSSDIGVKVHAAGKSDLNANITADELAKVGFKATRNQTDEAEIIFQGDTKLVFAIEARRFVFIDGRFRRLQVGEQPPTAMGSKDSDVALLGRDDKGELIKPLSILNVTTTSRSI